MDRKTEEILTRDSLAESEKAFGGKHWSQFGDTENMMALFMCARDNQAKENHLKAIGDTYSNMGWDEFKALIQAKGFIGALSYDIPYNGKTEEAILYYHPQKGLIIWATSFYNKSTINGGELYGEIKAKNKESEDIIWRWLSTGGCIDSENRIYETQHDIREGLFSKLSTLESAGEFLPKWTNGNRFLWFVDYVENKQPGYDYKKITAEKIAKCPVEFQTILS